MFFLSYLLNNWMTCMDCFMWLVLFHWFSAKKCVNVSQQKPLSLSDRMEEEWRPASSYQCLLIVLDDLTWSSTLQEKLRCSSYIKIKLIVSVTTLQTLFSFFLMWTWCHCRGARGHFCLSTCCELGFNWIYIGHQTGTLVARQFFSSVYWNYCSQKPHVRLKAIFL